METLTLLLEKAEDIVKDKGSMTLSPTIGVTTEYWTGEKMEYHHDQLTNVFWDYDADEIGFNTHDDAGGHLISELLDIEQHEICTAIINN